MLVLSDHAQKQEILSKNTMNACHDHTDDLAWNSLFNWITKILKA